LAERQGKARITTVRSPQSTLHNPIIVDHTRAAELESVLSLSALVLALFASQHLSCHDSCLCPAPGSSGCLPVGEELADFYCISY